MEVATANIKTLSEIMAIDQLLMKHKAGIAIQPRVELSTREVDKRRRHQSPRPEKKVLDHTSKLTKWALCQNKMLPGSTKTIKKPKRLQLEAKLNLSSLRNQEPMLDQSHRWRASGQEQDQLRKLLSQKFNTKRSQSKSCNMMKMESLLKVRRKMRSIQTISLLQFHRSSHLLVNLARWLERRTFLNFRSSLMKSVLQEKS
jgi:hypothetical protein